jgi:hypothetical protein
MKACPRCAREIHESATFCETCIGGAADFTEEPPLAAREDREPEPAPFSLVPAAVPVQAPQPGLKRRELLMVVTAVVFGGTIMLALLRASGDPASSAASTPAATASVKSPAAAPATAAARQTWSSTNREWIGNQRKAVAFELLSDNKVQVWQRHAQPILVVRCRSGRTEAFVYIESAAQMETEDENHSVRLRFDGGTESTERWADTDEHDALFAPDGGAFARRLLGAQTLQFGYTPHNAARVVANFQVSGLDALIKPAAKQCGWQ